MGEGGRDLYSTARHCSAGPAQSSGLVHGAPPSAGAERGGFWAVALRMHEERASAQLRREIAELEEEKERLERELLTDGLVRPGLGSGSKLLTDYNRCIRELQWRETALKKCTE